MKPVRGRKVREAQIANLWDDLQLRRAGLLTCLSELYPRDTWWEVFLSIKRKTPTVMKVIGFEVDNGRLRVRFWMDRRTAGYPYRGRRPYFCKDLSLGQIGCRATAPVESEVSA